MGITLDIGGGQSGADNQIKHGRYTMIAQVSDAFAKLAMGALTAAAFLPFVAAALNLPH